MLNKTYEMQPIDFQEQTPIEIMVALIFLIAPHIF
jgi:hypothetical protein